MDRKLQSVERESILTKKLDGYRTGVGYNESLKQRVTL